MKLFVKISIIIVALVGLGAGAFWATRKRKNTELEAVEKEIEERQALVDALQKEGEALLKPKYHPDDAEYLEYLDSVEKAGGQVYYVNLPNGEEIKKGLEKLSDDEIEKIKARIKETGLF